MARLFVLDAMALAYRAYYAFIRRPLVNSKGENTSALFGFANTALKIRREEQPDYWALAWDGPGPTFRHDQFADYKATRKPMPADLLAQIPAIEDLAHAIGLPIVEERGVEADDVMATLAKRGTRDGFEVTLVTADKDLLQLVDDHVRVLSPVARGEEYVWIDREAVIQKWGVPPEQIRDVLALMGDSVDNIPGVPGVGEKTALELIRTFGTLDALYERVAEVDRMTLREKLRTHRDKAFLSRDLVTVKTDLDLPITWDQLVCGPIRRDALMALARRYELVRLERIAEQLGVGEGESGFAPLGRTSERRGTAPEMRDSGVQLAEPPRPEAPPKPAPRPDLFAPAPVEAEPVPAPAATEARAAESRATVPETSTSAEVPYSSIVETDASSAVPSHSVALPRDLGNEPEIAAVAAARDAAPVATLAAPQGALDLWSSVREAEATSLDSLVDSMHEVRARALHGLALLPVSGGDDPRVAPLVGLAIAARDGTTCYVPIAHASGPNLALGQVHEWLGPALADAGVVKVSDDLKRLAHLLAGSGLVIEGTAFDLHLGSFLCDPSRAHGLDALAADFLGLNLPSLEAPVVRGRPKPNASALDVTSAEAVARARVAALFPLADALRAQLESREQWRLYAELEHPLIAVLHEMERSGVSVDPAILAEMSARAAVEIARLEQTLYELAGEPFNLNSGQQLEKILFEKLQLKPGRRTKTGFSTDSAVLEELAAEHPLPARLLEYRALAKLKSTYLDALPTVIDVSDGRVHTSFNQAGAATGRLSSSNPNLQNIPIRTEQGRAIRRAFVAPPGRILVGADYSQVELRVMAHLSGDPNLIEAFMSGEDVHVSTARRIFNVDGPLPPELRARAKVVNFGVMYGMGARSLSQQMGIGLPEAQAFIGHYFRVYSRVREFLDSTVEEARRRGYVQTLLGRRRYLPELGSTRGDVRSFAERAAINTPIQGSAADLMKLAMIRVHRALKDSHPSARLLLQVHDELLLEVPIEEVDAVSDLVRGEMEGCFPLRVPLTVSVGRGPTWFDVH